MRASCGTSSAPEKVEAIHRGYAEAGARVLTTNTFGGTAPRLDDARPRTTGSPSSTRPAAAIAREVADEHGALVAGDIGPTGELIEPLGLLSPTRPRRSSRSSSRGSPRAGSTWS